MSDESSPIPEGITAKPVDTWLDVRGPGENWEDLPPPPDPDQTASRATIQTEIHTIVPKKTRGEVYNPDTTFRDWATGQEAPIVAGGGPTSEEEASPLGRIRTVD